MDSQLDAWKGKKERHEQIAVGEGSKRSKKELRVAIDEIGRRAEGKGKGEGKE